MRGTRLPERTAEQEALRLVGAQAHSFPVHVRRFLPGVYVDGRYSWSRKSLDAVGERAGWKIGTIRTKAFRHTYCAARLQTWDGFQETVDPDTGETIRVGVPVAKYTVAKEMGQGGTGMVDRGYGHLGRIRHRARVVEYRAEKHAEELEERLQALGAA